MTHRGIWPARWLCETQGVSQAGFYTWLTRFPSAQARVNELNEQLLTRVLSSSLPATATYGARRVWHELLAGGGSCGRHRIERLMRRAALRTRPRRQRMPLRRMCSTGYSPPRRQTANGPRTSPVSGLPKAGSTSLRVWISSLDLPPSDGPPRQFGHTDALTGGPCMVLRLGGFLSTRWRRCVLSWQCPRSTRTGASCRVTKSSPLAPHPAPFRDRTQPTRSPTNCPAR